MKVSPGTITTTLPANTRENPDGEHERAVGMIEWHKKDAGWTHAILVGNFRERWFVYCGEAWDVVPGPRAYWLPKNWFPV